MLLYAATWQCVRLQKAARMFFSVNISMCRWILMREHVVALTREFAAVLNAQALLWRPVLPLCTDCTLCCTSRASGCGSHSNCRYGATEVARELRVRVTLAAWAPLRRLCPPALYTLSFYAILSLALCTRRFNFFPGFLGRPGKAWPTELASRTGSEVSPAASALMSTKSAQSVKKVTV